MSDAVEAQQLLKRIKNRRRTVDAYLRTARPRAERLTYASIISSALAAALTAGPALGGAKFTDQVADSLQLAGAPAVWRPLCVLAMVVSIIAAISANLSKAKSAEPRIIGAEACNAELEGLQALVEFHQVPLDEAVKLYQQYIARIPFVPETVRSKKRTGGREP
jgi:anti-sigma-K factor RskA